VTASAIADEQEDLDDNYIVVLIAKGGVRLPPNEGFRLRGFSTDLGTATIGLMTRFQEIGLPNRLPQELIFEVRCPGRNLDDAVALGSGLATSLAPLISFVVNAFVDVPRAHLAYEASPGRTSRRFWQADVQLGLPTFTPAALLRSELLIPFLHAIYTSSEQARLGAAISQHHAALRDWTTAGQPLVLMHMYPALEALAVLHERAERSRLGLPDKEAHAQHRGVDLKDPNWTNILLGRIRRDVICKGDHSTYNIARTASNGLEHGFMDMPSVRADAQQVTRKLFEYVREGVLDLLNLDTDVRDRLAKMTLLDVTPLYAVMKGVLSGDVDDVDQLGFGGDNYPRMEPEIKIDEIKYQPDGRLTVTPSFTYTVQTAAGVEFTPQMTAMAVGINDPGAFLASGPLVGDE
jgi:hypothetical protein